MAEGASYESSWVEMDVVNDYVIDTEFITNKVIHFSPSNDAKFSCYYSVDCANFSKQKNIRGYTVLSNLPKYVRITWKKKNASAKIGYWKK